MSFSTRATASCAVRRGRYPYDPREKPPSKRRSQMSLSAPCTTRSRAQHADFAFALGNLDAPVPQRLLGAGDQFVPELSEKRLDAGRLDRRKRAAVNPPCPVVALGQRGRRLQRLQLHHVNLQAPDPLRRVSLRRDVDPPSQVLPTDGRRCHAAPASPVGGGSAEQGGPFAPRAFPRFLATPDPSATLSPSADFPGAPVIRPTLLRGFRRGTRGASPVARCVWGPGLSPPAPPPEPAAASARLRRPMLP